MQVWLETHRASGEISGPQIEAIFQVLGIRISGMGSLGQQLLQERPSQIAYLNAVNQIYNQGKTAQEALDWWQEYVNGYLFTGKLVVVDFYVDEWRFSGLAPVNIMYGDTDWDFHGKIHPKERTNDENNWTAEFDFKDTIWFPSGAYHHLNRVVEEKRPSTTLRIFRRNRTAMSQKVEIKLPQDKKNEMNNEAHVMLNSWVFNIPAGGLRNGNWPIWKQPDSSGWYMQCLEINWERTREYHLRLPIRELVFDRLPRDLAGLVLDEYLDGKFFEKPLEIAGKRTIYTVDHTSLV